MNPDKTSTGEGSARVRVADSDLTSAEATQLIMRVRHEINNPLAALLGQAQLLLRDELSDSARRRAETIESLAIRIKQIVGELRTAQTPGTSKSQEKQ